MKEPGENQFSESQNNDVLAAGMQTPDNRPSLLASQQPSILQFGGQTSFLILAAGQPFTALSVVGCNLVPLGNNLSMLQINGLHPPIIQTEGLQSLMGMPARDEPTTSQARSVQPPILQTSAVQIGNSVSSIGLQTQSSLSFQSSTIHIGPIGQPIGQQPQIFQPTAYQTISSKVQSEGHKPVSYDVTTQTNSAKQVNRLTQESKKASKSQRKIISYVDVSCSACSFPKLKHASTNTLYSKKSIGTQVKIPLRHRSQGVQCPEHGYSKLTTLQTHQKVSTKKQPAHSSRAGVQHGDQFLQKSVMVVQDTEPVKNVSHARDIWQAYKLLLQDLSRIQRHRYMLCEHGQILFDDVAIYFSKDEWEYLNEEDKDLYMEMMVKNYHTLLSLGQITVKPPLITMIEQGEDTFVKYPRQFENPQIPGLTSRGVNIVNSVEDHYSLHKFSENLGKIIDDFLTPCVQQTEDLVAGTAANLELGPFCQVNPLLGQKSTIDEKPFRCLRCEKRFKRFSDLLLHQKCHRFENVFSCFQCSITFRSTKALIKHELKHTGEKPFICPRCGKRFSSQHFLDNHSGATLKKYRYVCSECGKRYATKYTLRKHEMVHSRKESFECSLCGKGFTEEDDFNKHERSHTTEPMQ